MKKRDIYVKVVGDTWGVDLRNFRSGNIEAFVKMRTKEDAVRYARVCEQRTGGKVLLPK